MIVSAVASVHENVEQRAGQNDQPGEPPEQVRTMFGDQVEGANGKKAPQRDGRGGDAARRLVVMIGVSFARRHDRSTFLEMSGPVYGAVRGRPTMSRHEVVDLNLGYSFGRFRCGLR